MKQARDLNPGDRIQDGNGNIYTLGKLTFNPTGSEAFRDCTRESDNITRPISEASIDNMFITGYLALL